MGRFHWVLFLAFFPVCYISCATCFAVAPTETAIIDENGHSLASLFAGLPLRALHDPPRLRQSHLPSVQCKGSARQVDATALVENGRPAPCPADTVCSGECLCPYPIGIACCNEYEAYNFEYECGECTGEGDYDHYYTCPNGSCCWLAINCHE